IAVPAIHVLPEQIKGDCDGIVPRRSEFKNVCCEGVVANIAKCPWRIANTETRVSAPSAFPFVHTVNCDRDIPVPLRISCEAGQSADVLDAYSQKEWNYQTVL